MELEVLAKKALKAEPVSSLSEVLSLYEITDLKKLAKKINLDISGKSKEEAEKSIFDFLTSGDNYKNYIKKFHVKELKFLYKAYKNGFSHGEIVRKDSEIYPSIAGATLFLCKGKYYVSVVDEIKDTCESFFDTEEAKEIEYINSFNDLAISCVVYYGAFGIRDFAKLYNEFFNTNISYEEVSRILTALSDKNKEYFLKDGLIIHRELNKEGFELLEKILEERKSKERCPLTPQLFDDCTEIDYFEFTPQYESLEISFGRLLKSKEEIYDLFKDIHYYAMNNPDIAMLDKFFEEKGIKFRSIEEKVKIYGHISEIIYVSRLWTEYGNALVEYEFNDLSKKDPRELFKKPAPVKKIGRNEPCPCGSGKKYKNCCAKSI